MSILSWNFPKAVYDIVGLRFEFIAENEKRTRFFAFMKMTFVRSIKLKSLHFGMCREGGREGGRERARPL